MDCVKNIRFHKCSPSADAGPSEFRPQASSVPGRATQATAVRRQRWGMSSPSPPRHEAEGTRGALTVPGRLGGAGLGLPASAAAPPCGSGGRHAQVGASGSSSRRPGGLGATFCLPLSDLRGQVPGEWTWGGCWSRCPRLL